MDPTRRERGLSPWRLVIGLGVVSLLTDVVSDGSLSVSGALLGRLGASATLVGAVSGAASALALVLRLFTGPWADRTGRYWGFTIAGYATTALCIPLLAATPLLGAGALAFACALILAERVGKAVRAPAKTALLAEPAAAVGSGRGFGVHKLLDQLGAFAGPLLMSASAAATGRLWPGFLALAAPAAAAVALLVHLRARVPDPTVYRRLPAPGAARAAPGVRGERHWRRDFLLFGCFAASTTFGLLSPGIISYHVDRAGLLPLSAVPLVYAAGMLAAALAAPLTGWVFDRRGPGVLLVVPAMTACVPALVLGPTLAQVLAGTVLWGAATGVQDSTVKALVARLVPAPKRGAGYGWFSLMQGGAALAGATVAGALYERVPVLSAIVVALQAGAFALLFVMMRARRARR